MQPKNIPRAMREAKRWIVWSERPNKHDPTKSRKVPVQKRWNDPENWLTLDEACERLKRGLHLGFVLGDGWAGVDVDGAWDDQGKLRPHAKTAWEACKAAYVEHSPSGDGFKAFVFDEDLSESMRASDVMNHVGTEVYHHRGRWFAVTGERLDGCGNDPRATRAVEGLLAIATSLRRKAGKLVEDVLREDPSLAEFRAVRTCTPELEQQLRAALSLLQLDTGNRNDWIDPAMALKAMGWEGEHAEAAFQLWHEWSSSGASYAGEDDCRKTWDTLKPEGRISVATIFHRAKEAAPDLAHHRGKGLEGPDGEHDELEDSDDHLLENLPTLPEAALYGVLRSIVDAATERSEATRTGVAAAVLANFAARFGGALGIDIGDDRRTLNLFMLVVGPTGVGRKGTSAALARILFDELDKRLAWGWTDPDIADVLSLHPVPPLHTVTGVSSGQGLIEAVRDDGHYKDRGREHFVAGREDKRLLVDLSEFSSVLRMFQQEGNILSQVLRDAYDGRPLEALSRTNPLKATGAHVCVLGHITMHEFRRLTTEDRRSSEATNGLLNRFLICFSVRDKLEPNPQPVPDDVRARLVSTLQDNVQALFGTRPADHRSRRVVVMRLTEGARALWNDEYRRLAEMQFDSPIVAAVLSRRDAHVLVLSALLAALNGEHAVGVEALRAGIAWVHYMATTTTRVFVAYDERKRAEQLRADRAKVLRAVHEAGGSMQLRSLQQKFSKSKFTKELQRRAIQSLLEDAPPKLRKDGTWLHLHRP